MNVLDGDFRQATARSIADVQRNLTVVRDDQKRVLRHVTAQTWIGPRSVAPWIVAAVALVIGITGLGISFVALRSVNELSKRLERNDLAVNR